MRKRLKRIRLEFDLCSVRSGDDVPDPEPTKPTQVALYCVAAIIAAIQSESQKSVKGDSKPVIPAAKPIDLVVEPGTVYSFLWGELLEAQKNLEQAKETSDDTASE